MACLGIYLMDITMNMDKYECRDWFVQTQHCFNRGGTKSNLKAVVLSVNHSASMARKASQLQKQSQKLLTTWENAHTIIKDRIQNCLDSEITTT